MTVISSIKPPNQINLSGFDLADKSAHMIAWLGRGDDFRRFVPNDIEDELYRQTPDAQVLDVECLSEPELTTDATQDKATQVTTVTDLVAAFPVKVRVRVADGSIWIIKIRHGYEARNIHLRDGRRTLRLNFDILESTLEE